MNKNKNKIKFIFIDGNVILNFIIIFCLSFTIITVVEKTWFKKDPSSVTIKSSSLDGGVHVTTKGNNKNYIQIANSHVKIKGNNLIVDGQDYGKIPENTNLVIKEGKVFISGKETAPL